MNSVLIAAVGLGAMGALFGAALAIAAKKFAVKVDPRELSILEALPNANCGACGFPGCASLAKAILQGTAAPTSCTASNNETLRKIAAVLGVAAVEREAQIAVSLCVGGTDSLTRIRFQGITDCRAVSLISKNYKACRWGCLGLGACARECPFDAIHMDENQLPAVSKEKCTGCGRCRTICPVGVMALIPASKSVSIRCRNTGKGKAVSSVCRKGCIGCRACVKACPVEAISMTEGLAVMDAAKCTDCGLCAQACPVHCIIDVHPSRAKAEVVPSQTDQGSEA